MLEFPHDNNTYNEKIIELFNDVKQAQFEFTLWQKIFATDKLLSEDNNHDHVSILDARYKPFWLSQFETWTSNGKVSLIWQLWNNFPEELQKEVAQILRDFLTSPFEENTPLDNTAKDNYKSAFIAYMKNTSFTDQDAEDIEKVIKLTQYLQGQSESDYDFYKKTEMQLEFYKKFKKGLTDLHEGNDHCGELDFLSYFEKCFRDIPKEIDTLFIKDLIFPEILLYFRSFVLLNDANEIQKQKIEPLLDLVSEEVKPPYSKTNSSAIALFNDFKFATERQSNLTRSRLLSYGL